MQEDIVFAIFTWNVVRHVGGDMPSFGLIENLESSIEYTSICRCGVACIDVRRVP